MHAAARGLAYLERADPGLQLGKSAAQPAQRRTVEACADLARIDELSAAMKTQ
jgi:hypothetical protein